MNRKHASWFRPKPTSDKPAEAKWHREFSRPVAAPSSYSHCARVQYEHEAMEIAAAELAYRNEDVSFSELYMFCQSFKPEVTVDDVINALGRSYRGE